MAHRIYEVVSCRCGFAAGGFDLQPKNCPRCRRGLKSQKHEIPGFIRAGAKVHYSAVIGEAPAVPNCYVTSDVFVLGCTPCVMIDKKRGAVAVEALSEAV